MLVDEPWFLETNRHPYTRCPETNDDDQGTPGHPARPPETFVPGVDQPERPAEKSGAKGQKDPRKLGEPNLREQGPRHGEE